MTTMYTYFKQMRNGSLSSAQPPLPSHSPYDYTPDGLKNIFDTDADQYS